ncbi:MAG: arginine deiminase family protein, partial [Bacteroidota bacterium]
MDLFSRLDKSKPMEDSDSSLSIRSDVDPLKKVIVHLPDEGIEWVTPTNKDYLLYDDIVYLPHMQEEHRVLQDVLAAFGGDSSVYDIRDLLEEILRDSGVRTELLEAVRGLESLSDKAYQILSEIDTVMLSSALLAGYIHEGEVIVKPLPNLIFTRDIGAMVNGHALICHANKAPRKRENLVTWFVLHHHPMFTELRENDRYIDISGDARTLVDNLKNDKISIEGGDIMMIDKGHLLIACSERTSEEALSMAMKIAFDKNVVKKFTIADIPKEAYCMHIDTIFTKIDDEDFVYYHKLFKDQSKVRITQYYQDGSEPVKFDTLEDLIRSDYPNARMIKCAKGEEFYEDREQWTMACNTVAVKPGVVLSYERNTHTFATFEEHGYHIVMAEDILSAFEAGLSKPE